MDAGDDITADAEAESDAATDASVDASDEPVHCEQDTCYTDIRSVLGSSCALSREGKVFCWGGTPEPVERELRAEVSGLFGSVNTGLFAVTKQGALWGREGTRPLPIGASNEFVKVAPAASHSCAILTGGRATCWKTDSQAFPLEPAGYQPPLGTEQLKAVEIAATRSHACLIDQDHGLWCWDRIGSALPVESEEPDAGPPSPALEEPAVRFDPEHKYQKLQLTADGLYALTDAGELRYFEKLELGGAGFEAPEPTHTFSGPFRDFTWGVTHGCAWSEDGRAFCWGENTHGQLGRAPKGPADPGTADGSAALEIEPEPVAVDTALRFRRLSAGRAHTCGLSVQREVFCWGNNDGGLLGKTPQQVVLEPKPMLQETRFKELSLGSMGGCAVSTQGELHCWGESQFTGLPMGTTADGNKIGDADDFLQVAVSGGRGCGIRAGNQLWCWGRSIEGSLGVPDTYERTEPFHVFPDVSYAQVALSSIAMCGLDSESVLRCSGSNRFGVFGATMPESSVTALPVHGARRLTSVLLREGAAFGIDSASVLFTWSALYGQNYQQTELGTGFRTLSSGADSVHQCALTTQNKVSCWGVNTSGQVGQAAGAEPYPSTVGAPTPVDSQETFVQVVTNQDASCALTSQGALYCWGDLVNLTSKEPQPNTPPTHVLPTWKFKRISLAAKSACAITDTDRLVCWGYNGRGALGSYETESATPVRVPLP